MKAVGRDLLIAKTRAVVGVDAPDTRPIVPAVVEPAVSLATPDLDAVRKAATEAETLVPQGTGDRGPAATLKSTSFGLLQTLHATDSATHSAFDPFGALATAGIGPPVVDRGPSRTAGLGITVPLMQPLPSFDVEAYLHAPLHTDLTKMRIAVAADHGAYGRAEETARILKAFGVGEVVVFAPLEGERMNYGISSHAALQLLEDGKVDRVIAFCGNGLGALDIANQHAVLGGGACKAPVYGDNLWRVADGKAEGANVLALGARLLSVENDPMKLLLRAFLDDPPAPSTSANPVHGVSTTLIDPKPERIKNRTLSEGIDQTVKLSKDDRARIAATAVTVYFNPNDADALAQRKALKAYLPPTVKFVAWDGAALPVTQDGERALLLSAKGCPEVSTRAWGFFVPDDESNQARRVHRAEHRNSVRSFARDTRGSGGLTLDLPSSALTDNATGGAQHDVFKLLVKTFLLEQQDTAPAHKALYGEALQFGAAMIATGAPPEELAGWGGAYEDAVAGARRF